MSHDGRTGLFANETEILSLIETLHLTGQRLELLTAGEVDTVANREGRPFLLQHAQERLRQEEAAKQANILNVLPAHIALLDPQGIIVAVNDAWRQYASVNGLEGTEFGIGTNYLAVCDRSQGHHATEALSVASGIRSVMNGTQSTFSIDYPCHSPTSQRWFRMSVTPLKGQQLGGAVVMHLDISKQKLDADALLRFGLAMDSIADSIYLVDRASMRFVYFNTAACRMSERTRDQLLATRPWELLAMSRAALEQHYDEAINSGVNAKPIEIQYVRKDGTPVWLELRYQAQCSDGRWTIVTLMRDATERKESEAKIRGLIRVHAVLSGINSLIVRVRSRDELFQEACQIGLDAGGFRMAMIGIVESITHRVVLVASAGKDEPLLSPKQDMLASPEYAEKDMIAKAIREHQPVVSNAFHTDLVVVARPRHPWSKVCSIAVIPLLVAGEAVGVLALYSSESNFFHVEEMKLLTELAADVAFAIDHIDKQERLKYLAYYDELTGLANRTLFLEQVTDHMNSALTQRHGLALYVIDIERFRNINDSLGRATGDVLLRQVAECLTSNAGDANLVARLSADQFAVVMPGIEQGADMMRLLETWMQALLQQPFRLHDAVFRISAKAGAALYPDDGVDAQTLLRSAEAALKKAKVSGERYLFHTHKMSDAMVGRLKLENQLRQAIDQEEFVLHYQPKVNLASGKITGAEALIRWNDPQTGLVPPSQFIPVLEETGMINEVGRWAMHKALADYLRWRAAGLNAVRIAVNVSPMQLQNRSFIAELERSMDLAPEAAAGLELEVTESVIMEDVTHTITTLNTIRAMGLTIALDDFGTGFSSLSYLANLPINTLKIDRSFVIDMTMRPQGLALVSTIITLAHALKFNVVAEGVETKEQSHLLQLLTCDEMQGFLFSKPVPADIFESQFLVSVANA
jgi:diguanylate cyclase (GGDEF)-like protein/PAS domain S-box-containing protein